MDRFHRALLVAGLFLFAMTRSDGESVFQWRERWRIKSAEGKGWGFVRCSAVSCPYSVNGNAKPRMGRARRPGRHGGEAPALCVGTDDVGLEFLVLLFQDKRTRIYSIVRI